MRVIYFSNLPFSDCDFPLIREMQHRKIDVYYFVSINPSTSRCALVDIKKMYDKNGIFKAAEIYPQFLEYKNYIDLDKVYVVNYTTDAGLSLANVALTYRMVRTFMKLKPDIVQITWPLQSTRCMLYLLRRKLVLTLHDPFPHSDKPRAKEFEMWRKLSFRMIDRIIILNKSQLEPFSRLYSYPLKKIYPAWLGLYDCINGVKPIKFDIHKRYVLFFGYISKYKGIEYLLEAFNSLQNKYKDVQLVIAGKGELYFDKSLYKGKENITIINDYINIPRLSGLLQDASFVVCPYKDATQSGVIQTAFSMDCPVVVSNVGALPEAVDDGETGLIVPPCDTKALASAIDKMLSDGKLLQKMRKNINDKWRIKMGWDKILDKYLECYHSIIKNN